MVRVRGLANRVLPGGEELNAQGVKAWNRLTMDDFQSVCRTSWMERKH